MDTMSATCQKDPAGPLRYRVTERFVLQTKEAQRIVAVSYVHASNPVYLHLLVFFLPNK